MISKSHTLLQTKLFIPPTRPRLVPRPRLIELLNEGLHRKLTLISAPPGFGKTTLVTEWLDNFRVDAKKEIHAENRVAWLSLDEGDNDSARFLTYFIAALNQIQGIDAAFGKGALSMLQSPQPPPTETILTSLINEITTITASFIQAFTGSHHFVFDYLVEEVLQRQPKRVHSFLLQTSILDRLSGPLCDAVRFGFTETPSSSKGTAVTGQDNGQQTLEYLEQANLFVVPLDDKRQSYRYHHLFADVLLAHLLDEQPDQVPILHRRASEWYERNSLPADAVRHALAAEARLRDAERWLDTTADMSEQSEVPSAKMIVVDEEQFRSLPVTIANARAIHAQALGDVSGTVKYARRALDLLPEGDYFERGRAAALLGLACWASGDLETGHRTFADALASFQMAGNILFAISGTFILADIRMVQGRLHEAVSTYERSLQLAREQGEPMLQGTADLYLGLSELHREQGDLEAARQQLLRSEELGEQAEVYQYRWCRAQARIKEAQGDLDGALELIDEAEWQRNFRNPLPDVRPIAALKTRVWIAQGNITPALVSLERALTLAEPQGYVRIFVDEGPPMAALLREAAKHGIAPNYISQLRAAFGKAEGRTPVTQLLIEPLSERELEVLRLLGTELNGPEIARELTVSLHTIRTHTQNIYNKLGVNKRRAAVRRAEELDLL